MMDYNLVINWINSFGLDRQPISFDENYHMYWDVGWLDVCHGIDCRRWSFTNDNGNVEYIDFIIYDFHDGGPRTRIYKLRNLGELYNSMDLELYEE